MCHEAFGVQAHHAGPVLNRFLDIFIAGVFFGHFHISFVGLLNIAGALEQLGNFFVRNRIIGRDAGRALVDLQGILKILQLIQCQGQVGKRLGVVGKFSQCLAVKVSRLIPGLVPGSRVTLVDCLLKAFLISWHKCSLKLQWR